MKNRKKVLLVLFLLCSVFAKAQSDIMINHRWVNQLVINPAAIEKSEYMNLSLMTRNQWQGFDGAPASQFLTASAYWDNIKSGLGLVLLNDKIGYSAMQSIKLNYSYQLSVNENLLWAFGISSGYTYKSIDRSKMDLLDPNDPEMAYLSGNRAMPNLSVGTELRHKYFTVGASIAHWEALVDRDKVFDNTMNNYVYAIGHFNLSEQIKLSPAAYYINRKNVNTFEANAVVNWSKSGRDILWGGAGYRFSISDLVFMAGAYITKDLSLGYSYELNLGDIQKHSNGSHEFILRYRFIKCKQ